MNARQRRHAARARTRARQAHISTAELMRGPSRNRKATRMTAAFKDSEGNTSDWARSMHVFTDPAWSRTISDR